MANEQIWAAVALVIYQDEMLLIQRSFDPRDPWSGHFSFPGGRLELGETPLEAAIRECAEEVGLELQSSDLLAELQGDYAGRTQGIAKLVQPFVFEIHHRPDLNLDLDEVARTLWIRREDFCRIGNHRIIPGFAKSDPQLTFPCYPVDQGYLWGFSYEALCQYWQPV